MDAKIVLIVSLVAQLGCAVYALLLTRITGAKFAWIAISIAFLAMAARRFIPLVGLLDSPSYAADPVYEALGLALSLSALAGVVAIGPIFREWRADRERLRALAEERGLLLREAHHRVRNNLNTIISMLRLHAAELGDGAAAPELEEASGRVATMALLYEQLFGATDRNRVSSLEFLSAVVDEAVSSFPAGDSLSVEKEIADFAAEPQFIQLIALVLNEAIANALKYAFEPGKGGRIAVSVSVSGAGAARFVEASVEDDGRGIDAGGTSARGTGFGSTLIAALSDQLNGSSSVSPGPEGGTTVRLRAPIPAAS